MRFMTLNCKPLVLALLAAGALPVSASVTLPATSPYMTDPQTSYVQDATSDGISSLNMVLCIMDSMRPAEMVNKGPYVALVDLNKCDPKSQSSTSNATAGATGATAAPNYMNAVVDVTRASNSDPMIGKVWMSMTNQGNPMDIFVHLTGTQSPTDLPPYGKLRVDYIGYPAGLTGPSNIQFNGFIDANGADVNYLETGANSSNDALTLNATSTTTGSGTMTGQDQTQNPPVSVTFNFAYDSGEASFPAGIFRRDFGSSDVCFDRSKDAAAKSVWNYGTYNANDGSRVDQANPGFQVLASYRGSTYYGFASYWGINFQGLDLNNFADGLLSSVIVADQRPGISTTYALSKNSGKLTKWTQNTSTLAAMDGIPFNFWGDLTGLTTNPLPSNSTNSWMMQWDNANSRFVVVGYQVCGNSGCTVTSITPTSVLTTAFNNLPISGWANSFGGNITIPPNSGNTAHTGVDAVNYYSQSDVIPGSTGAPTALHCLNNCPTSADMSAFNTGSASSPYNSSTTTQWGTGTVSVAYTFGGNGLADGTGTLTALITDVSKYSGQFQGGIMSGRLFDDNSADHMLSSGCPSGSVCEPGNPSVYYTWQTGPNQWNQDLWLTNTGTGTVVNFDAPENVAYTVPSGAAYGSWAGKTLQLQFNGFGNLQGIPGGCVNPNDNSVEDCSTVGARYVPDFSIPDGATMTLTDPTTHISTPLIVKGLDEELRLAKVACSGVTLAQPTAALTLPSVSDVHDPSNPADPDYLGVKPVVTAAPAVIQGVIQ